MKKAVLLFYILFFQSLYAVKAQSSKLCMKQEQAASFYAEIIQSTLVIPINDKKDPEEKALLDAVKRYWTICPYKILSRKVFNEMQNNHTATPPKTFYLLKETYERLKRRKKDWAYTKYYITTQNLWVEEHDEPYLEFKLPLKTINHVPTEVPCGYLFDLMIKHFNNELLLMKNSDAYTKLVGRKRLIRANFKHSLKPYASKQMLVSKNELENYMLNLSDDDKDLDTQQKRFIKSIAKKTKLKRTNIKMASEEEIKTAITKADANTLIYTGYSVYNAQDALMLKHIDPNKGARPYYWILALTVSTAVVVSALIFSGVL